MDHNRPISHSDHEVLILLRERIGDVVLTPIFHNGEARQAIAIVCQNETGIYLRILGVTLNPGDDSQDKLGQSAAFLPPMASKEALN